MAFALAIVRELAAERGHLEPALEVKGFGRAACAFVANTYPYSYAKGLPLRIAPEAEFELGLDMVAPRAHPTALACSAPRTTCSPATRDGEMLYAHDADRIEIVCDRPMPLQVDGEDLGDVDAATFEAERGAVTVLA